MNDRAVFAAWEAQAEADYLDRLDREEQREASEESILADIADNMVEQFLINPAIKHSTTYTIEQAFDEVMTSSIREPHSLAFLDLARRAAMGEEVNALARELLGKLATEWVDQSRETYLKDQ